MPHELTERDDLILRVVECLGFVPEDELKHGAEVYKISDDPTVSLPSVLVETGRMSKKHMDAVEAVVDARLAAEKSLAATHRVSSSEKMDEITREKEEARKRAAEAGVFSARSKKDVKSAWAAYKKGADSAQPEEAAPGVEESVQTAPRAAPGR